jgi:acetyl-CoA carboxylase carboxyltransferase component
MTLYLHANCEIAVMGPEGCSKHRIHAKKYVKLKIRSNASAKNSGIQRQICQSVCAAARGYIDEIIEPQDTRRLLLHALQVSANKAISGPNKKHGIPPF